MSVLMQSPLLVVSLIVCIALSIWLGNRPDSSLTEDVQRVQDARTPEDWLHEYNCSMDRISLCERASQNISVIDNLIHYWDQHICIDRCRYRQPAAWMYKYFDELRPQDQRFEPLVLEASIDERLANIIYLITPVRALRGDMNAFKFDSGSPEQDAANKRRVAGPRVDNELCARHLKLMVDLSNELEAKLTSKVQPLNVSAQHLHLARVLDSFGRYESGYLSGRHYTIGSYEQCTTSRLEFGEDLQHSQRVNTRHCWAIFNTDRHLSSSLQTRERLEGETGENLFRTGICIPESCHTMSFDDKKLLNQVRLVVNSQFKLPKSIYHDEHFELESVFCPVDGDSEMARLPPSGKYLLVLLALWVAFVAVRAILATSRRSHSTLAKDNGAQQPVRVNMDLLNVLRALLTVQMVVLHSCGMVSSYNINYLSSVTLLETDPLIVYLLVNTELVDTFFVISGMLLTFSFMRRLDRIKVQDYSLKRLGLEWFRFTLGRYLKLVPLLALVVWFKKTIFPRLSLGDSGPLWDYGLNRQAGIGYCVQEQSWWTLLIPTSHHAHLSRHCIPAAWTITTDLLFAAVLPLVIYLLLMQAPVFVPALGTLVVGLIFAQHQAFATADGRQTWHLKGLRAYAAPVLSTSLSYLYTNPWYRLSGCFVGLLAGFFVYLYAAVPEMKWHKTFTGPVTGCAVLVLLLHLMSRLFFVPIRETLGQYCVFAMPHSFSTLRLLYIVALAIVLVRVVSDCSGDLTDCLGSRISTWLTTSKLSYAIILVHWDVMTYDLSTMTRDILFGKREIFYLSVRAYAVSWLLGLVIYHTIQGPLNSIVKKKILANI